MVKISETLKQFKSICKPTARLLASLVLVTLIGITTALPAHADDNTNYSDTLNSLVPTTPIFNSKEVRLGITPTGWSNSDDLSIDLVPPIPYQQILSEMALSGFKGSQGAPKFPKDINELKREFEMRGLTISEPWVGTYFTIGNEKESQKIFEEQMAFMKNFDIALRAMIRTKV